MRSLHEEAPFRHSFRQREKERKFTIRKTTMRLPPLLLAYCSSGHTTHKNVVAQHIQNPTEGPRARPCARRTRWTCSDLLGPIVRTPIRGPALLLLPAPNDHAHVRARTHTHDGALYDSLLLLRPSSPACPLDAALIYGRSPCAPEVTCSLSACDSPYPHPASSECLALPLEPLDALWVLCGSMCSPTFLSAPHSLRSPRTGRLKPSSNLADARRYYGDSVDDRHSPRLASRLRGRISKCR